MYQHMFDGLFRIRAQGLPSSGSKDEDGGPAPYLLEQGSQLWDRHHVISGFQLIVPQLVPMVAGMVVPPDWCPVGEPAAEGVYALADLSGCAYNVNQNGFPAVLDGARCDDGGHSLALNKSPPSNDQPCVHTSSSGSRLCYV